jgi:uncharacterized protein (DUF433 family)
LFSAVNLPDKNTIMVKVQPGTFLGAGLYTLGEAALYARLRPQTLARWFFGSKQGASALDRQLNSDDKVLSFLDFVQALAVRSVRITHRVPLTKIRHAVKIAESEYGIRYPFARMHTTYLVGSEIIIKLGEDEYAQISGKHAKNRVIAKVVELYMKDLSFDPEGLAQKYDAFVWNGYTVSMNPHIRFGEPMVVSCGYSASALYDAFKANEDIDLAAREYGVTPFEIEVSIRYFDHLVGNLAA